MTRPLPTPRTHGVLDSPLGPLTVLAQGGALLGLWMESHRRSAHLPLGVREDGAFTSLATQLNEYFVGDRRSFDVPVAPEGEEFQRRVWDLLLSIPYGQTRTYGDLARALGQPGMAQAVGGANARNPISIVIPCHRVVGASGALTGYAGGLAAKRFLLALEAPSAETGGRLF